MLPGCSRNLALSGRYDDFFQANRQLAHAVAAEPVIGCGCLIAMLAFGPRSALGFFLTPMSARNGWGRDVFAFALAIQNLLWGAASRSPARSPTASAPPRAIAGALFTRSACC